jgi:hypothetical protein
MRSLHPDHPDEIVRRILIRARIIAMQEVANATARFFAEAQRATGMPAARVAAEMEQILDRDRLLDPPCLKRGAQKGA